MEAFITLAAFAVGTGFVIVWREIEHLKQVDGLREQIAELRRLGEVRDAQIDLLKDIMIKHWPSESVRLSE